MDKLPVCKWITVTHSDSHILKPEYYGITKYKWNDKTGLLDCYQDVILNKTTSMVRVPFNFGEIHGDFKINYNYGDKKNFLSLKNGPRKVFGSMYLENIGLESMEYFPEIVTGSLMAFGNNFNSLIGCPKKLRILEIQYNNGNIIDLSYGPKECDIYSIDSKTIRNLDDYPLCIINERIDILYGDERFYEKVCKIQKLVKANENIFRPLLDDKVKFHQQVMRMLPELIPHYTTIKPPTI